MVKRFSPLFVYDEDKKIAKGNAGLQGLTLAEYISKVVRDDAKNARQRLESIRVEQEERPERRRSTIGWFKR